MSPENMKAISITISGRKSASKSAQTRSADREHWGAAISMLLYRVHLIFQTHCWEHYLAESLSGSSITVAIHGQRHWLHIQPQCWIWKQQVCPLLWECTVFNILATTWIAAKVQSDTRKTSGIEEIIKKQISNILLLDIGIRKEPRVTIVEWQLPTRSPTWRLMLVSLSVCSESSSCFSSILHSFPLHIIFSPVNLESFRPLTLLLIFVYW